MATFGDIFTFSSQTLVYSYLLVYSAASAAAATQRIYCHRSSRGSEAVILFEGRTRSRSGSGVKDQGSVSGRELRAREEGELRESEIYYCSQRSKTLSTMTTASTSISSMDSMKINSDRLRSGSYDFTNTKRLRMGSISGRLR